MKAHEIISSPDKWTRGAYARNCGAPINMNSNFAECFCVSAAIRLKHNKQGCSILDGDCFQDFKKLANFIGKGKSISSVEGAVIEWNDSNCWTLVHSTLVALDI